MKATIETADNGWIVSWIDDNGEIPIHHRHLFEIPDHIDQEREDPESLINLLCFIKEEVCGQYWSKHKTKNVMIIMDDNEE